jgi:hypothetical protein
LAECPKYRSRLFLSVDLVGSTAFKAGRGSEAIEQSAHPLWVWEINKFYQEFPATLRKRYSQHTDRPEHVVHAETFPSVWKTIGDEIVFCCRVNSAEHLVCLVLAFTEALDDYGRILEVRCKNLDVKGTAWLAAFPAPNVTVNVRSGPLADLPDEAMEIEADKAPQQFDFLGRGIDCGFRLTRFSSTDKLTVSVELAFALCESANSNKKQFSGKFNYLGREELKGVINGRPYPIVTIITERSEVRREVYELERNVRGVIPSTSAISLRNFLSKFMLDEGIEHPLFTSIEVDTQVIDMPASYVKFRDSWGPMASEEARRGESEEISATQEPDDTHDGVPEEVESVFSTIVAAIERSPEAPVANNPSAPAKPDGQEPHL